MTDQSSLENGLITVQALSLFLHLRVPRTPYTRRLRLLASFFLAGKFNNSETFAKYKSQKVLLAPSASSSLLLLRGSPLSAATTIIRKTFEGTKVRTFVPSFSSLCPCAPPLHPSLSLLPFPPSLFSLFLVSSFLAKESCL